MPITLIEEIQARQSLQAAQAAYRKNPGQSVAGIVPAAAVDSEADIAHEYANRMILREVQIARAGELVAARLEVEIQTAEAVALEMQIVAAEEIALLMQLGPVKMKRSVVPTDTEAADIADLHDSF